MCHGERDTDRRRGREISGRIRSKAGRGTCDSKDRGGNRYAIFFGRAPWFRGCWETGKVRSRFENLLGKLEYGLICLPTATAARLPLSKAVTFQLLQLLWSCSVDVLLDQCQSTNPTPDSPPPLLLLWCGCNNTFFLYVFLLNLRSPRMLWIHLF